MPLLGAITREQHSVIQNLHRRRPRFTLDSSDTGGRGRVPVPVPLIHFVLPPSGPNPEPARRLALVRHGVRICLQHCRRRRRCCDVQWLTGGSGALPHVGVRACKGGGRVVLKWRRSHFVNPSDQGERYNDGHHTNCTPGEAHDPTTTPTERVRVWKLRNRKQISTRLNCTRTGPPLQSAQACSCRVEMREGKSDCRRMMPNRQDSSAQQRRRPSVTDDNKASTKQRMGSTTGFVLSGGA
jgi:hypothetical protein